MRSDRPHRDQDGGKALFRAGHAWTLGLAAALLVILLNACSMGFSESPPVNTVCALRTVTTNVPYCSAWSTVKTGSIADRFCDSHGVCSTTYRDQISQECSVWSSRPMEQKVCDYVCAPGFSPVSGFGTQKGCYAGDELARQSAKQAEVLTKAGKIRTNCNSIRAAYESRLQNELDSIDREYIDYWRKGTADAPTTEIRSWDELKPLLLSNSFYPRPCVVTGFGKLPTPSNVGYFLVSSDLGDNQPATNKTQRYLELIPRSMAEKFGWSRYYLSPTAPAKLAEACNDFIAGKLSTTQEFNAGNLTHYETEKNLWNANSPEANLLWSIRASHGLWCIDLHSDLWPKVVKGLKQDTTRVSLPS